MKSFARKLLYKLTHFIPESTHYVRTLGYIARNKKRVQEKAKRGEPLNAVFLVQYIPAWNKLEAVYARMKADKRFRPTIVCVPLGVQKHTLAGNEGNDTYAYFKAKGYEVTDALLPDGGWYDITELKPDYVFHSRPYNDFMPECYTGSELAKTALVCNVLYGANLTADFRKVMLNKNYYSDVYCYFAFSNDEMRYYKRKFSPGCACGIQKCFPYGTIALEQVLAEKSEKQPSAFRKTVMWTPRWSTDPHIGGSNFFKYKDVILTLARENPDVKFVLRPHPLMFDNFVKTGEMTEQQVSDFKQMCITENNLELDEDKEYVGRFWNSDMLITDLSGIVPEYFVTGKPILYCHSDIAFRYTRFASDMIRSCYEIRNSRELTDAFGRVLAGADAKQQERNACMQMYLAELSGSGAMVEYLANPQ